MILSNYRGSQKFFILLGDVKKLLNIGRTMMNLLLKEQPREKLRIFVDLIFKNWPFKLLNFHLYSL